jgi:hypothetical protein
VVGFLVMVSVKFASSVKKKQGGAEGLASWFESRQNFRMKTKFILGFAQISFVGLFVLGSSALASTPEAPVSSESRSSLYERYEPTDLSSHGQRANKVGFLTVQPIGFAIFPFPSMGINGGYFIDADKLVQIEVNRGKLGLSSFDIATESLGVNLKYFTGNSFYVKAGAAYRSVSMKNAICFNCAANNRVDLGAANAIAAELAVGNQWQWENFTFGCDWIGLMVPLVTAGGDPVPTDIAMADRDRTEINNLWNQLNKSPTTTLLRFYLGASF